MNRPFRTFNCVAGTVAAFCLLTASAGSADAQQVRDLMGRPVPVAAMSASQLREEVFWYNGDAQDYRERTNPAITWQLSPERLAALEREGLALARRRAAIVARAAALRGGSRAGLPEPAAPPVTLGPGRTPRPPAGAASGGAGPSAAGNAPGSYPAGTSPAQTRSARTSPTATPPAAARGRNRPTGPATPTVSKPVNTRVKPPKIRVTPANTRVAPAQGPRVNPPSGRSADPSSILQGGIAPAGGALTREQSHSTFQRSTDDAPLPDAIDVTSGGTSGPAAPSNLLRPR